MRKSAIALLSSHASRNQPGTPTPITPTAVAKLSPHAWAALEQPFPGCLSTCGQGRIDHARPTRNSTTPASEAVQRGLWLTEPLTRDVPDDAALAQSPHKSDRFGMEDSRRGSIQ